MDEDMNSVIDDPPQDEEEKVPLPKIKDKLYRKKFDFLYKRTCFRLMGEFFKQLFAKFAKTKRVFKNMSKYLKGFQQHFFGDLLSKFSSNKLRAEFSTQLNIVINSHRHNNSSLLESGSVSSKDSELELSFSEQDFQTVRDVMYRYSKKA